MPRRLMIDLVLRRINLLLLINERMNKWTNERTYERMSQRNEKSFVYFDVPTSNGVYIIQSNSL